MKKFFNYLGIILLLAIIVAAFTSTGKEQCTQYMKEKMAGVPNLNLAVSEAPFKFLGVKIFAIYSVTYYKLGYAKLPQSGSTANPAPLTSLSAQSDQSGEKMETYVGLYNTFWKW